MKITTTYSLSTAQEVVEALREEFSDQYAYTLVGRGRAENVVVRKNAWVRALVATRANEVTVEGTPPPIVTTVLSMLLGASIVRPWQLFLPAPWRKLEKEISGFLHQKYNA